LIAAGLPFAVALDIHPETPSILIAMLTAARKLDFSTRLEKVLNTRRDQVNALRPEV